MLGKSRSMFNVCMQQVTKIWALTGWGSRLYSLVAGIAPCSGDNYTVYCLPWGGHYSPTTSSTTPEKLCLFCDEEKENTSILRHYFAMYKFLYFFFFFGWKLNKVSPPHNSVKNLQLKRHCRKLHLSWWSHCCVWQHLSLLNHSTL